MATKFPFHPSTPTPNGPFSYSLNPYVCGPWWPSTVGSGLTVCLADGYLNSTGGGGGGVSSVSPIFPINASIVGSNLNVSIIGATTGNPGAVQLTSLLSSTSNTLALTAAAGKSLQDQINALALAPGGSTLVGTIDGSTGFVATIVNPTVPGFTVGSPLPNPSAANATTFVLVTTPGTMTPPGGSSTAVIEGDWWYSNGTSWTLIPIGITPGSALPATPFVQGLVYGCTTTTASSLGCGARAGTDGIAIGFGAGSLATVRNPSSIVIGAGSNICCAVAGDTGGIVIGNKVYAETNTVALISKPDASGACRCFGRDSIFLGAGICLPGTACLADNLIVLSSQPVVDSIYRGSIAIGSGALAESGSVASPLPIGQENLANIAIGRDALCQSVPDASGSAIGNVAIGHNSGAVAGVDKGGSYNVLVGWAAGNIASQCSIAIGREAAFSSALLCSVAIGPFALTGAASPVCGSVVIGSEAGNSSTVNYSVIIGNCAGGSAALSCSIVIGAGCGFNPPSVTPDPMLALGYQDSATSTRCCWLTGCCDLSIRPGAGIRDCTDSVGTVGQVLTSNGNSIVWSSSAGGGIPAGALMNFAGNTAPTGWLVANGDTIPNGTGTVQGVTANFSALYAVLGTAYGGAGKLPDMRGMFARGWDSAGGAARNCDPGRALGSLQGFALQNITGEIKCIAETFANAATPASPTAGNALYRSSSTPSAAFTPISTDVSQAGTLCFNASLSACTAAETRPMNVAVLPCIKY